MSLTRLNGNLLIKRILTSKKYSTLTLEDEYTKTPQYPEILDVSYDAKLDRKKQSVYNELQSVKTVEEKQIKLNMPKYYGFKCYMFNENLIPYDQLDLTQHITRTHLVLNEKLPQFYNEIDEKVFNEVKSGVEEVILTESYLNGKEKFVFNVVKGLNRVFMNSLSKHKEYLKEIQVDFEPRIESFWFAGGMAPPENVKRYRKGQEFQKHKENDPTNRAIQYIGNPLLQIRSKLPLKPVLSPKSVEEGDYPVPFFKYDPRVVGVDTTHRHATNIPGFWPGDNSKFGLISFHDSSHISKRDYNDAEESKEAVHRQGILASFSWLNSQANNLGFTTFNELTYPLFTQTILTNGQQFSFYLYQLNTLLIHSNYVKDNPQKNVCYATPELKLYEEIVDGKLIGFNDDVLKNLLKLYLNEPEERLGVKMTPYLSQEEKVCADYKDVDKRIWLEREFKFLTSNRPRYKLDYEVYAWEKIYKIDHETRPMEARRRPFELFQKPSDRRLNDRQAFYIPKVLRPNLPKQKGRYAKEYFP
ncbi:uncharacterized protein [Onthophagus taurus]|uniref:uncharacterized protein n=1 Tax=Onthophagus taurus TaxID=166361 RepID=UPI000C20AA8A|nr:uncharacterized protein LOC111429115 [Onthophagus taurus]XP_022920693.1 uncharacterized protein LOC111429115 [Onthophagus taurus]